MRTKKARWLWVVIIGLFMVPLLAACDDDGGNGDSPNVSQPEDELGATTEPADDTGETMTVEVSVVDNAFEPAEITVAPGTTVIWTNNGAVQHTVTAGERDDPTGMFDSGMLDPGGTFQFTFTEEGTFPYHCVPHSGMDGVVIVTSG